jgi:SAM-dependent methyltransferase
MRDCLRQMERGRLAYYNSEATSAYWDSEWKGIIHAEFFEPYHRGELSFFDRPFSKYISSHGKVLEAGCGVGQYVIALRARGYDCVGIDYAADTVARVKSIVPDLPIFVGDITKMEFASNTFESIISLGVVEHRREGPEPFIREMRRVLNHNGRLLISVPHFNPLRRYKARRGFYQGSCSGMQFYQWAFSPKEFRRILAQEGFGVVDEYDYNYFKCLLDELAWLSNMPTIVYKAFLKGSGLIPGVKRHLGHMRLFICEKRHEA